VSAILGHHLCFEIEESDIVLHEADQPDIVLLFLDADVLSGKDLAQIDFPGINKYRFARSG
jgi:hypothetical protein